MVLLAACVGTNPLFASGPKESTLGDLMGDPGRYDGKEIVVIGVMQFDAVRYPYLFSDADHATRDDPAGGLDVGTPTSVKIDGVLFTGPHCVAVSGRFMAYNDRMIITGNPRSRAGVVRAESVKRTESRLCR